MAAHLGNGLPQPPFLLHYSSDVERSIRHAKRAARSELSVTGGGWTTQGLAQSDVLEVGTDCPDTLFRVDARSLTVEEFAARFEGPGIPVILTGLTDDWPAGREWTDARLLERFGDHRFKVAGGRVDGLEDWCRLTAYGCDPAGWGI